MKHSWEARSKNTVPSWIYMHWVIVVLSALGLRESCWVLCIDVFVMLVLYDSLGEENVILLVERIRSHSSRFKFEGLWFYMFPLLFSFFFFQALWENCAHSNENELQN